MTRVPTIHAGWDWLAPSAQQVLRTGRSRPPVAARPPSNLLGTYTATLKRIDLPAKPPPELTDGSRTWKLTIACWGGVNCGAAFTVTNANARAGQSLESSSLDVRRNDILLRDEERDAGGTAALFADEYAYKLTGRTLALTAVKNHRSDHVARTILTSEPSTRTDR